MLLEVKGLTVFYGSVEGIRDVSFSVAEGEIVAMIGPNGAGKSTTLKAVSGVLDFYRGEIMSGVIEFDSAPITQLPSHKLADLGIAVVPEGRRVFPNMSVQDNLEIGGYTRSDAVELRSDIDRVYSMFPILKDRRRQLAGTLSGGEQQMLALGRALMLRPKLLMADEPSLGLSPNYVDTIFEQFVEINKQGVTLLLVEQNARMALDIAHRGIVFDFGTVSREGQANELCDRSDVQRIYLGG